MMLSIGGEGDAERIKWKADVRELTYSEDEVGSEGRDKKPRSAVKGHKR